MGQITQGVGPAVEAQAGPVVADRPMFFSASAMEYMNDLKYRLSDQLWDFALRKVREEGRTTVTDADLRATIEQFGATLLHELNQATK